METQRLQSSAAALSSVERGERKLSLSSLLRLAEGLEMNPAKLVDGLRWTDD